MNMSNKRYQRCKNILIVTACAWMLALIRLASCEGQEPVGMIMNTDGDVRLLKPGQENFRPGNLADFLFPGSQIQTGKASQVVLTLFFDACYRVEVGENSQIILTDRERQITQGAILKEEKITHCYRPGQMSAETGTVPGATVLRDTGVPVINGLFPANNTVIINLQPEFRWKRPSEQAYYRFTLYRSVPESKESEIVWQSKVSENHLVYPASQLPLAQGQRYVWNVEALEGERVIAEGVGAFSVLDRENMVRVEEMQKSYRQTFGLSHATAQPLNAATDMKDPTPYLLFALCYEHLGAWGDALSEYQRIAEHFPDSPALQRSIAFMYDTLGLEDEAQKTWAVVDRLEKKK